MRNFLLSLFLSQGIPMLLMGDEIGQSKKGNNNSYVQDNEINWFNWNLCKEREDRLDFVSSLIAFRKNHTVLHQKRFLTPTDIDWHGTLPGQPDWGPKSRFVAFTLKNPSAFFYVAFNASYIEVEATLPSEKKWYEIVNTALPWNSHSLKKPKSGRQLESTVKMAPYSAILAIAI